MTELLWTNEDAVDWRWRIRQTRQLVELRAAAHGELWRGLVVRRVWVFPVHQLPACAPRQVFLGQALVTDPRAKLKPLPDPWF